MRHLLLLCFSFVFVGCPKAELFTPGYESPEKTFGTWKHAAQNLDYELLVSTYASGAQEGIRKQMNDTSGEGLKSMQKEAESTDFKIEKIVYEDQKAYLRVRRSLKEESDIEIITMIQESGAWKILP